ncbi:hypothetical protein U9M48_034824 [Paspalum notatum var. saurae]|uniref:AT-hook motif nuclear-localized protein n=1 Tax=Paspalum notatum var. saurae TaxID=547442 RepID=A0AAQ3X720_PASNO
MEGREGIAVAGAHESGGHGLFRADVSMTEAQEAAKGYHYSPSSPSTSPTPSPPPPPPPVAGHGGDATPTPLAWSLGGDKPSEAAGDNNGMQTETAGQSEHANLSSGRRRGRPRGSGRRQILATLGEWYALTAGGSFTPHVIIVGTGEDVAARIMSFSQKGPRSVCILSANGTISNVTLRQPDASGSSFTYEGRFEILQLMGSFTMAEEGRRRTGGLSVSLAGPDGRVVGGVVAGMLRAASDRGEFPAQQPEAASEEDELTAAAAICSSSATSTCGSASRAHGSHADLSGSSWQWLPCATVRRTSPTPCHRRAQPHEPELRWLHHGWLACELAAHGAQGFTRHQRQLGSTGVEQLFGVGHFFCRLIPDTFCRAWLLLFHVRCSADQ